MASSNSPARIGCIPLLPLFLDLCARVAASQPRQVGKATATVSSLASITFGSGNSLHSTTSFNVASASTYLPNTDFSNEQLNFLWDQIASFSCFSGTPTDLMKCR